MPSERRRRPFEPWRKVMLTGAFLLLGLALVRPVIGVRPPDWVYAVVNFCAYGLLAVGFVLAMRARREAEEKRKEAAGLLAAAEEEPQDADGNQQHPGEGDERDASVVRGGLASGIDAGPRTGTEKE